jgi:hypothetical protein
MRIVATAVALIAAGGCASSQQAAAPPARGQVMNELTAAYVQYAGCARDHGLPDLPDPQVDDQGNDHYPPGSIPASGFPASVIGGCATAWDNVRHWRDTLDSMQRPNSSQTRTAAQFQSDLRVAACIRRHGFPDFPDPSADDQTTVTPPPGFDKQNLSPAARAAILACRQS